MDSSDPDLPDPFDADEHPGNWIDEALGGDDADGELIAGLDALDRLDVVISTTWDLTVQMEAAFHKAVQDAVHADHPWAEIGERLGLTEQQARHEYGRGEVFLQDPAPGVTRSAELTSALVAAHRATVEGRGPDVDTDHLLEGLLRVDGTAAAVLNALGVTRERVRTAWLRTADPRPRKTVLQGYSAPARTAVAAAEMHAVETTPEGTPVTAATHHLLAVLLADPSSRACVALAELDVSPRVVRHLLSAHTPPPRNLMGRRFRYGPRPGAL
ncbi:Clp protease N-terminal domain-containing protein [Streptomyces sp. NPDC017979]|uniref:Clp protease N-terminal domain-containing protein n=1 Tax=Streptomyces sp. NPDC017979 TaxID=3365024 RepID=UPI0037BC3E33